MFRPQLPPERLQSVAMVADAAGLDELWLWEDCFYEAGVSAATAALAWTPRLRVGIGLLPAPLRNVALTAMEVATVARLFPGRIEVGIGHGVQEWMAQVGAQADSPMTLLREYAVALRSLLDGESVTMHGRYVHLDGVTLDWPPSQVPPLILGAVGPRTVALSAELADGTLLTGGTTPETVRRIRSEVDAARSAAGRGGRHTLIVYVVAATGPDAANRLAAELRSWSLDPAQDVAISGDAAQIAAGIRRWAAAGADAVILQPTADEDLEEFVGFIAREVQPLC
ncbi:MAG: LLM class flavin-dependent oxidoreductase [Pseudonocardiales bacterium]